MELKTTDLIWSSYIYPRGGKNDKTIDAYTEALKAGARFPPIKVQRVYNYPTDDSTITAIFILDGIHRWFAFQERGIEKILVVEWKKEALDYEKHKITLLLESAECNISHGDRLSASDKKRIARDIALNDPECKWTESTLAEKLGVTHQTVNIWISDIRARQKASRNTVILRLNRLGWSQGKISEKVGLSQNRVSEIIGNANICNIDNLLSQGHDMEYIARHYNMDLPLVWALHLEGKTDQEKFQELGWGLRTCDQWSFNTCDERFGDDCPGRIPAQLVAHALYYYTKPGHLVLDLMAGGGVVSDVCLLFERKCESFDLAVMDNRPEIRYHHWDAGNKDWPVIKKPDFIFLDPPYYRKKAGDYGENSISNLPKQAYLDFFAAFFTLLREHSKKTTWFAFLNADWLDFESTPAIEENPDTSVTIFDYHRLLTESGWKVTRRLESPLSTERLTGNMVQKMQDKRIIGTVGRTLLISKIDSRK